MFQKLPKYYEIFSALLKSCTFKVKPAVDTNWETLEEFGQPFIPASGHTGCHFQFLTSEVWISPISVFKHYILYWDIENMYRRNDTFKQIVYFREKTIRTQKILQLLLLITLEKSALCTTVGRHQPVCPDVLIIFLYLAICNNEN